MDDSEPTSVDLPASAPVRVGPVIQPEATVLAPPPAAPPAPPASRSNKAVKWLLVVLAILVVLVGVGLAYWYVAGSQTVKMSDHQTMDDTDMASMSATPSPTVVSSATPTPAATGVKASCGTSATFADAAVGMTFCYPKEWGVASVLDSRASSADTGYRQSIVFSNNSLFAVGGTSQDWSTAVGRGVSCLEPDNQVPLANDYDTAWHDIEGQGMDVTFAQRSLPSLKGGYDMTESVGSTMQSGICVQGHKVINGSRYQVAFAAYSRDFSEAAGITTPRAHMDAPNVLFSQEQRAQFDALLASLVAY
jgi:hypothetical protein